jgi:REP element-mobilizing transposase RayT
MAARATVNAAEHELGRVQSHIAKLVQALKDGVPERGPDHVHLLLSAPPHLSPSRVMQAIKGKTSHHLLQDHRRLRAESWGRHLWARGYFVCTSRNVTDEVIAQYIQLQGAEPEDDDRFRVSE